MWRGISDYCCLSRPGFLAPKLVSIVVPSLGGTVGGFDVNQVVKAE